MRQVAEGLRGCLGEEDLPVVPVGPDYLVAIYWESVPIST